VSCSPEVGDALATVRPHEHVLGLEVTVNEPDVVGGREPLAGAREPVEHLAPAARLLLQPLPQRSPLDELHRDEHVVAHLADLVDGDDLGVAETRHGLCFAHQACVVLGLRPAAREDELQRDLPVEGRVVRRVDRAHAPLPHEPDHDEAAAARAAVERRPRRRDGSPREHRDDHAAVAALVDVRRDRTRRVFGQSAVGEARDVLVARAGLHAPASLARSESGAWRFAATIRGTETAVR
jgi:hypothetical protein